MITLYINYIILSACIGNIYAACLAIPCLIMWDIIIVSAIKQAFSRRGKRYVYMKDDNEGYHDVDWNCNGKIDYWEK